VAAPSVTSTPIAGLLLVSLDLRTDSRGWFKESWQRAKMLHAGVPDFEPVQQNVSFNTRRGTTRGIHAEPWDKLVSVAAGRVFGAWVDLRRGSGFGRTFTHELGPGTAVFVPRGVGNGFQTLEDRTAYSYLVNAHWSPTAWESYTFVNVADATLALGWPVPLAQAELSEADRKHPRLADVLPVPPPRLLVVGAEGQLGRALTQVWPEAAAVSRRGLDLTDPASVAAFDFSPYGVLVNAAAYTAVDAAETPEGRREAWAVNVGGVAALVRAAHEHHATLVHFSSDYVFDGTVAEHDEEEPFSPLGVYGQTKAAGDALVATLDRHYLLRTSWVVGAGANFVAAMARLADQGVPVSVVDDQHGRLTFTSEIARAVDHLLSVGAPHGTYNLSGAGPATSWADIAQSVFVARGRAAADVTRVTTAQYGSGRSTAPRPPSSTLALAKIRATGFQPAPAADLLQAYLAALA
jgi:dTDP-4-dehydrorhamnose reductase/dTDP-4-dehydrorhamnose 3,5-epimerase